MFKLDDPLTLKAKLGLVCNILVVILKLNEQAVFALFVH